jgi:hypothetical protein
VVGATKTWLSVRVTDRSWLSITLKPSTDWTDWWVQFFDVSIVDPDLRYALLAACVEANRKLKEAA